MNTDLEITLEFLDSPTEVDFFAVAGAPGHDGQDGADGRDGADGHTPVITASKQGTVTTISVDGDPVAQILDGATGAKGDKGDKGDPGQDGAKGDKGDTGAKGDKGDKGDTGAQGIQGIQGEKGDTGAKGDKGDKGDTGATGAAGQDGHTPVKGTDYWTAEDKAEIVEDVTEEIDIPVVASGAQVKDGSASSAFIAPSVEDAASFYGLAKAAGDSTQSASSNTVGNYTDAAKVAIQKMLGIYEAPWELIKEGTFTNSDLAEYIINTDTDGQAFELTDAIIQVSIAPITDVGCGVGDNGRIYFRTGTTNKCTVYCYGTSSGTFSSTNVCSAKIIQQNGLVEVQYTEYSGSNNHVYKRITNTKSGAGAPYSIGSYVFDNVRIGSVKGTVSYRLLGKRKWQ